jgi:hypothetical protein
VEKLNPNVHCDAAVFDKDGVPLDKSGNPIWSNKMNLADTLNIEGVYNVNCVDIDGNIIWEDVIHNTVVTVGKNLLLSTLMTGSTYTVTGPFMGLISSVSYTAIAAGDTMASHGGWLEAGVANAPTYTIPRPTAAFSAASAGAIALSAALSFAITGTGTVEGVFIVLGTGAVSTIANTSGTLFSAGVFTGGAQAVVNTNTLNVSWSVSV